MVPEKKTIDTQNENQPLEQTSTVNEEPALEILENEKTDSTVLTNENGMERAKDKKVPPLFKRRFRTVIAFLVAILVLVGSTVATNLLVTEEVDEEESYADNTILVKQVKTSDIEKIVINGSYGEVVLVSKETKTEEDTTSSGSSTETQYTWELEGFDKSLISSSSVNAAADNISNISATRIMEKDQSKKELYGLDKPTVIVDVFTKNNKDYTLTVGDASPDSSGYYASITGDNRIYLLSAGTVENFNTSAESMADVVIVNAPNIENVEKRGDKKYYDEETGMLNTFDSIELSGPLYGQKAVITPITDNEFVQYNLNLGSYSRFAEPTTVDEMFSIMTNGLVAMETYVLEPSEAEIKKYGLDSPEVSIAINYGSGSTKIKATMYDKEQMYYAVMVEGRNAIYAVSADALTMLQYKLEDYYYTFVFQEFIYKFKNMTVETPNKNYSFDIRHNTEDDTFVARANGEQIDDSLLSAYYQYFLTLSPEVKGSYKDGEASLTATFTYSSESKGKVVIELIKQSARRYLVRINGNDYGTVNSTAYDHLVAYAEYVMIDKGIPEP